VVHRQRYTPEEEKTLADIQNTHNDATYKQLRALWQQQTGSNKPLSNGKIASILKTHHITSKNLIPVPVARNTPANIQKRAEYCLRAMTWDRDKVIWIDETGFDKHIHRRRGRSPRGKIATYTEPNNAGGRVNICAAVNSVMGLLSYRMLLTSWNQDEFAEFISKLLSTLPDSHIIVVDGVKWHHTEKIKDVFNGQRYHHQLELLPPYSPHLNPIEYCFHVWKSEIKNLDQTTAGDMSEQIERARTLITPELVSNCLTHVYQYYAHCITKKPLEEFIPIKPPGKKELKRQREAAEQRVEEKSDL